MLIQDVISIAKYSELGSLAVKDNIEAVVAFINLGMLELYTRFPIKTKKYTITLVPGQTDYDVPLDFMYVMSAEGDIKDNTEPFTELPINDVNSEISVVLNNWKVITITTELQVDHGVTEINVSYVSKPIAVTDTDLGSELELPDSLVDALVSYVGYRGHLGVRSEQESASNAHWIRFERSCKKAREAGVAFPITKMDMSERVSTRGFV